MEWVVTTGKTVADAKDAALDELGVDEVDAEFELLEEPRQGLFGRQRGEARVRARVRPTAPRPKTERRDRHRRKTASEGTDRNARSPGGDGGATSRQVRKTSDDAGAGGGPQLEKAAADAAGDRSASGPARPRRAGTRRGAQSSPAATGAGIDDGGSFADGEPGWDDDDGRTPIAKATGGTSVPEEELSLDEQGQVAEKFLTGLLERFGAPASTEIVPIDDETVEIRVEGSDLGLLIGPKGQTLQAIQELTRTVVQRRSVARTGRILVDVAGYRVRRRDALERFTRQVAADVLETGVQRVLEPMTPADRKVVHDTANDIDGVRTMSEGEDVHRRVVIIPVDDGHAAAAPEKVAPEKAGPGDFAPDVAPGVAPENGRR